MCSSEQLSLHRSNLQKHSFLPFTTRQATIDVNVYTFLKNNFREAVLGAECQWFECLRFLLSPPSI